MIFSNGLRALAVMAVVGLLAGCEAGISIVSEPTAPSANATPAEATLKADLGNGPPPDPRYTVRYHHDAFHRVSCWVTSTGVSCLPDSQVAGTTGGSAR